MKLFFIFICFAKLFGDLIYPQNNDEINHIHVMFEWEKETEVISYEFEMSNSSDFSNILINSTISDTNIIVKDVINWQSNYYWRVKPSNEAYINTFPRSPRRNI